MTTLELQGIAHELGFWKQFVQTPRFLNGWVRKSPTPELNDIVKQFLHYNAPTNAQILDVGSGVVSILHGLRPDLSITAADPLGQLYELIFEYKRYRIDAPLPVPAEELNFVETYDIVHCSNAMDHSQHPMQAYIKMRQAVKPGGWLIIQGFTNEAIAENWQGFHQWNIDLQESGAMMIRGKDDADSFGLSAPMQHHKMILPTGKEWFIYIDQKK